ncbi:3-deoxy-D-manno-octulosonic acid transferase [Paucibacter sp. TC2R-5]|uniref:3-deoxy-D-manno-octulosonic acid transferase n=1 Tax=Paucibacter sp. TC2R-5 TaxID=2893555 RepID=UPI0021E3B86A|nr:3-deoxy-D-manno-octulosonic acid transferase [Paucibacter sp. TC2R-5]MCV2361172.1 3-deoxy-D-manno-octulosonic acid transferase [Paucibacter sp. TC2R-5]
MPPTEAWSERLSRWAYTSLLRLLTPFYLLRLWRRGAAEPLYRQWLLQRLGFYGPTPPTSAWVWVHAVSLGETRAAAALIDQLRLQRPAMRLLLTHSTATGRAAGLGLLRDGDAQAWLPYDTPGAVRRFLRQWRPAIGILMETEIWPQLQFEAARQQIPMVLANARLSARSQRRGERFKALLHPAGRRLTLALAQTEADAERLRASAVPKVLVQGNLKFDMQVDAGLLTQGRRWHEQLGRPVLLAAVTREGEETMLLQAWRQLPQQDLPLLLIVPRHPQRFDEVAALVENAGLTLARRSTWQDSLPEQALMAQVWLGDSMREMALYYAVADDALLGGSFAPLGGQNLIEAAACGCPIVMGPHTFNFAEAAELAEAAGAALRVADISQGLAQALSICKEPGGQRAEQARQFAAEHRGAAARMASDILALLPSA